MAAKQNEWVKTRWQRLIDERGGKCEVCLTYFDLEFAHVEPTECRGKGRGKYRRLRDILKHPGAYRLLCMACHDRHDGRVLRHRQPDFLRVAIED